MAVRTISQRDYSKGLVAVVQELAQPRGTVQRVSNMLYTRRGGLKTCDGAVLIAEAHSTDWTRGDGAFLASTLAALTDVEENTSPLSFGAPGTVGNTPPEVYPWAGLNNVKVEDGVLAACTIPSVPPPPAYVLTDQMECTNFGFSVPVTATVVGVQFRVRRIQASGYGVIYSQAFLSGITGGSTKIGSVPWHIGFLGQSELFTETFGGASDLWGGAITPAQVNNSAFGVSFRASVTNAQEILTDVLGVDYITLRVFYTVQAGGQPPQIAPPVALSRRYALREVIQPLEGTVLLSHDNPTTPLSSVTYADTDIVAELPESSIQDASWIDVGSLVTTSTVNGGVLGRLSAKPQLFTYQNRLICILGNGYPPQQLVKGEELTPLTNDFAGSVPEWGANTPYIYGTIINASPENDHYYRCVQAGVSGVAAPTFPTSPGVAVADGNSVIWEEAGTNSIVDPRGAAHAIVHAGFLWLFNTYPSTTTDLLDGPSCLAMSDLNNPNSYNPINRAFIDKDDTTEGMGLASLAISELGIAPTLTLVAFKNYSTYVVNGVFGDPNFSIIRAKTDLGCIAPRTIQFLSGLGIMRLTHKGFAIFNGIKDVLVSDTIRPYIFNEVPDITPVDSDYMAYAHAMQTDSPPMYVASLPLAVPDLTGQQRRLFCFDLISRTWTVTDVPFSTLSMSALRPSLSSSILSAELNAFVDGRIRAWQAGGATWEVDTADLVAWNFQSQDVFGATPSDRTYFRRVFLRGIATGTVTIEALITVNGTGQPQVAMKRFTLGSGRFEAEVPIMLTGLSANARISGLGSVEINSLEWHAVPKPAGMPASIMQ